MRAEFRAKILFSVAGPDDERFAQFVEAALETRLRNACVVGKRRDVERRAEVGGQSTEQIRALGPRPLGAAEGVAVDDVHQTPAQGRGFVARGDMSRDRCREPTTAQIGLPCAKQHVLPGC